MTKHMIITGGAGFIGSYLAESLVSNNKVTIIDDMSTGKKDNLVTVLHNKRASLNVMNVSEISLKHLKYCHSIFHFASRSDVMESMMNPRLYFEHNVLTTVNLLDAMRKADVSRIIFSSSSVVYGQSTQIHKENSEIKPISIYGTTKLICESLVDSYCKMYGLRGLILRFANIVGPRASKGIIHDMIDKFQKNPKKLLVLGNGHQTKSYLNVHDCIDAILKCHNKMDTQQKSCNIYNVSNSDSISVNQVIQSIAQGMRIKHFDVIYKKYDKKGAGWKGDITIAKLDISKIKRIGWSPRYNCSNTIKLATEEIIRNKKIIHR